MVKEFATLTGDIIERRAASALGPGLPPPDHLPLLRTPGTGRGRVGRALLAWLAPVEGMTSGSSSCRRIPVAPGVEVLIDEQHPALRLNGDTAVIAEALRQALGSVVGLETLPSVPAGEAPIQRGWSGAREESEMIEDSRLSPETHG